MNSVELNWPSSVPRILWMRRNCPRCSSIEFQTADSHPLDRLLGLLAFVSDSLRQLLAAILLV